MNLPFRGFTDLVRDMSAAIIASSGRLIDLSVGSVLRAIIEANAAIVLWVQWLILLTLQSTRAATSIGADLDSWMADFSVERLRPTVAAGTATLSRYSGTSFAYVPVGTIAKTQDGLISFAVTADISNPAWQTTLSSYALAVGVTAIDVSIIALVPGPSGNVLPDTITVLASSVPGIDLVCNTLATKGGEPAETDEALRKRFGNFFASRSRATIDAIEYAISLTGSNLKYLIQENVDAAGSPRPGSVAIIVDDGSGTLGEALSASLFLAIDAVRPIGTNISIRPPEIVPVQVSLSISHPDDLPFALIWPRVQSAIEEYISQLPIAGTLSVTRVSQIAYQAEPRIINISNVLLNRSGEDLVAPAASSFKSTIIVAA